MEVRTLQKCSTRLMSQGAGASEEDGGVTACHNRGAHDGRCRGEMCESAGAQRLLNKSGKSVLLVLLNFEIPKNRVKTVF